MFSKIGYFHRYDWVLMCTCVLLVGFGLMALYSTSLGAEASLAAGQAAAEGDFFHFWKQAIFAAIGIAIALIAPVFNYRLLSGASRLLYWISVALLIAVLLFGQTIRGTTGWFGLYGLGIQPVELVKVFLIVYFARFFSDYSREPGGLRQILGSGAALAVIVILVALQPDFGSALMLVMLWGGLLLMSGVKRPHLIAILLLAVVSAGFAWAFVLKPYQQERLAVFWDPSRDPLGRGYNVTQSIIAIGSGELAGRGIGFGSQSQLRFLPERQTDFIFAVMAEEMGFFGVLVVMVLFGVLFYRGYRLAREATDDFTLFLILGIMISIAAEVFTSIGGNLRLLPVTGVTLPFMSYGGSSLLTKFLMLGILQSIAVRR